jgi:hypothetical protein
LTGREAEAARLKHLQKATDLGAARNGKFVQISAISISS